MLLLMYGVFNKQKECITKHLFALSSISLFVVIYLLCTLSKTAAGLSDVSPEFAILAFDRGFIFDNFAAVMKSFIAIISIAVFVIALNSKKYAGSSKNVFEFPVLMLLSIVGMFLMVSANDLITFYIGLELQSLALYVLVAINRDSEASTESGVKYFVLGALASGVILFGASLIYGFSGSTNLGDISSLINTNQTLGTKPIAVIFGFVLLFAGIFFKLSAVPMHMWAPDVYQGSTKAVLAFIATAPKVAAFAFLIRLISVMHTDIFSSFGKIIALVSALSMIVGALAALRQENIKRLLAYSSIGNVGFIMLALSIGNEAALQAGLIYIFVYMIGSVGIFAVVTSLQNENEDFEKISDFAGLSKSNPIVALAMAALMFSIAGIPPLSGFFGKFFVFKEAIKADMIILSVIGVVSSVVACFYYLRIIKVMYFDELTVNKNISKLGISIKLVLAASVGFSLLMIFFTNDVIEFAKQATISLF